MYNELFDTALTADEEEVNIIGLGDDFAFQHDI